MFSKLLVALACLSAQSASAQGRQDTVYAVENGDLNDVVRSISVGSDDLFVGGYFTEVGGVSLKYLAKVHDSTWSQLGSGLNGPVTALRAVGNELYAGGSFTMAGDNTVNYISHWDGGKWLPIGSGANKFVVSAICYFVGNYKPLLCVGGDFDSIGGVCVNHIALWNDTAWLPLGSGANGSVEAIAVGSDGLYVGGSFTIVDGIWVNHIAKWDSAGWHTLGTGVNGWVYAIAIYANSVYVGGTFTTAGDVQASHVARWDGTNWYPVGYGFNDDVFALAFANNGLYAGGNFTVSGYTVASHIARWDGISWSPLGTGVNERVFTIGTRGSEVYVGGAFTEAGGKHAMYIAKWNSNRWGTITSAETTLDHSSRWPASYRLEQNYPNPFNPLTVIRYSLRVNGYVSLNVYDVLGREVATLVDEVKQPGEYTAKWDASNVPSGVYFYQLKAGRFIDTKKMLLAR